MPKSSQGFTVIELLLSIIICSLFVGIFLLSTIPNQNTETKKRQEDISLIATAFHNYVQDNRGVYPSTITAKPKEICKMHTPKCRGLVDLSFLTLGEKYLTTIPVDPTGGSMSGTGYFISTVDGKTFTVTAQDIERNLIFETRK